MNDTTITLCGWVGSPVSTHPLEGGSNQISSFRVASTPRRRRNGQWENLPTAWFTVKAFRHLARHLESSIRVGDPVIVTGRLEVETWERPNAEPAVKHVVVATAVGHDLNRGTSAFAKAPRQAIPEPDNPVTRPSWADDGQSQAGADTGRLEDQPADDAAGRSAA